MTKAPLYWIKTIESALVLARKVPLWGSPPPFPWELASSQIRNLIDVQDLSLVPRDTRILRGEEIQSGLGKDPVVTSLELTPLPGTVHWVMPADEVAKLSQLTLGKGGGSPHFQRGFYQYLILQALEGMAEIHPWGDLSATLGESRPLPEEEALCVDIALIIEKKTLWGRLICPQSWVDQLRSHFGTVQRRELFGGEMARQLDLSMRLEVGHVSLTTLQWTQVSLGDFLILDRCSYDPQAHKGTGALVLDKTPLFQVKIRQGHMKVLDYSFYEEAMTTEDEDYTDPGLDDFSGREEGRGDQLLPPHDVPMTLSVEVARIRISLEKLLELKPGNLLELSIRPEEGVDLIVSGKRVGKGELVKLGETLGIKILQIGK